MKTRVRSSAVVVHDGKLLTFRAVDPQSGREYLFLPGGGIEPHETAPESAERETLEETGYRISVDPASCIEREYFFFWNGEDFDCLTLFYRGTLLSPFAEEVRDASYHRGVVWVPLSEVDKTFAYNRDIASAVRELIND